MSYLNSQVFKHRQKIVIDGDDVTSCGRLFNTRAAAKGKARSPFVECKVLGTTSAAVDADHGHCRDRDSMSATH